MGNAVCLGRAFEKPTIAGGKQAIAEKGKLVCLGQANEKPTRAVGCSTKTTQVMSGSKAQQVSGNQEVVAGSGTCLDTLMVQVTVSSSGSGSQSTPMCSDHAPILLVGGNG
jgi:hypothetical protein